MTVEDSHERLGGAAQFCEIRETVMNLLKAVSTGGREKKSRTDRSIRVFFNRSIDFIITRIDWPTFGPNIATLQIYANYMAH